MQFSFNIFHITVLALQLVTAAPVCVPVPEKYNYTSSDLGHTYLALENLEVAFLNATLASFDESAFRNAGYPHSVRLRLGQMLTNDQAHLNYLVTLLTEVESPVNKPCVYRTDLLTNSNVTRALVILAGLEQILESTWIGLAYYGVNFENREIAAIVGSEARHNGWLQAEVLGQTPWTGPWDSWLTIDQSISLLNTYTLRCPENATYLPPHDLYPSVNIQMSSLPVYQGPAELPIDFSLSVNASRAFMVIQSGVGATVVPVSNASFVVPDSIQGFAVGMLVSENTTSYSNSDVIAGPVLITIPFGDREQNPGLLQDFCAVESPYF